MPGLNTFSDVADAIPSPSTEQRPPSKLTALSNPGTPDACPDFTEADALE